MGSTEIRHSAPNYTTNARSSGTGTPGDSSMILQGALGKTGIGISAPKFQCSTRCASPHLIRVRLDEISNTLARIEPGATTLGLHGTTSRFEHPGAEAEVHSYQRPLRIRTH